MTWFYCWDVIEGQRINGEVYLFGHLFSPDDNIYTKCFIVVPVERQLFISPYCKMLDSCGSISDIDVTLDKIQEELKRFLNIHKIQEFRIKFVEKKNPFYTNTHANINNKNFVELRYLAKYPAISSTRSFRPQTFFPEIIGSNKHLREIFLLDFKIKGPCWLNLENFTKSNGTEKRMNYHTEYLLSSTASNNISVITEDALGPCLPPPPPLVALGIHIRRLPGDKIISMVSLGVKRQFVVSQRLSETLFDEQMTLICPPEDSQYPIEFHQLKEQYNADNKNQKDCIYDFADETALIKAFLMRIKQIGPDLIIGYDLDNAQIHTLTKRIETLNMRYNLRNCCRIGFPPGNYTLQQILFSGRLACDIKQLAKELLDPSTTTNNSCYDLKSLKDNVLHLSSTMSSQDQFVANKDDDIENKTACDVFSTAENIMKIINHNKKELEYVWRISDTLNMIQWAMELAKLTGCTMTRCLVSGQAEKVENLLLNAFSEENCIVPDWSFRLKDNKNCIHVGGLVLDAKVGLHEDYAVLLDFNSLYPSIIREYDICFTTALLDEDQSKETRGILPKIVWQLVEKRRQIKNMMKDTKDQNLKMQLNIKQRALKMLANSVYGCLGFSNNRFFSKALAILIAAKGREILSRAKLYIEEMGYEIIYGDTDSLMVKIPNSDYEKAKEIGTKIKTEINETYKYIQIDIDKIFQFVLLTNKKNYAGLMQSDKEKESGIIIYKGLDICRRDRCKFLSEVGKKIVSILFKKIPLAERTHEIYQYMDKINVEIKSATKDVSKFVIQTELKKEVAEYGLGFLPAIYVANRYKHMYDIEFRRGDCVPFLICLDGTENQYYQRSYHLQEYTIPLISNLRIDIDYYLKKHVGAVLERLCASIPDFDVQKFRRHLYGSDEKQRQTTKSEFDKFYFTFTCWDCQNEITMDGPLTQSEEEWILQQCPYCPAKPYQKIDHIISAVQTKILECEKEVFQETNSNIDSKHCSSSSDVSKLKQHMKAYLMISKLNAFKQIFNISRIKKDKNMVIGRSYEEIFNYIKKKIEYWEKECMRFGFNGTDPPEEVEEDNSEPFSFEKLALDDNFKGILTWIKK